MAASPYNKHRTAAPFPAQLPSYTPGQVLAELDRVRDGQASRVVLRGADDASIHVQPAAPSPGASRGGRIEVVAPGEFRIVGGLDYLLDMLGVRNAWAPCVEIMDAVKRLESWRLAAGLLIQLRGGRPEGAALVNWQVVEAGGAVVFDIHFRVDNRIQQARPRVDDLVVVGTAAIDGDLDGVPRLFGVPTLLDLKPGREAVVGGRRVRVKLVTTRGDAGAMLAVVGVDVLRKRSEIEAEERARQAAALGPVVVERPTCPECGPHGNLGHVQLAEVVVACTTCNGGRPGDTFGSVAPTVDDSAFDQERMFPSKAERAAKAAPQSFGELQQAFRDVVGVPRDVLLGHNPGAFQSSAEAENWRRHLAAQAPGEVVVGLDPAAIQETARRAAELRQRGEAYKRRQSIHATQRVCVDGRLGMVVCVTPSILQAGIQFDDGARESVAYHRIEVV
jgi:hypothetical protein